MFTLPWGHLGDGHAFQSPTRFALDPLCFGCWLLKANYPLTEACLHTTFAETSQSIGYFGPNQIEEQNGPHLQYYV